MSSRSLRLQNAKQEPAAPVATDYTTMQWPALMKLGKERKLFAKGDTKPALIAKLQASDES